MRQVVNALRVLALVLLGCISISAAAQDKTLEDPSLDVDIAFLEIACVHIENGDYNNFSAFLERHSMAIEDVYPAINCELVDYPGVTIMHTMLETNLGLLRFANRIMSDIQKAKGERPELNTAAFFNRCINGSSVLDLLKQYKRVSANNPIILERLRNVEAQIIALGALPCPERLQEIRTSDTGIPF